MILQTILPMLWFIISRFSPEFTLASGKGNNFHIKKYNIDFFSVFCQVENTDTVSVTIIFCSTELKNIETYLYYYFEAENIEYKIFSLLIFSSQTKNGKYRKPIDMFYI